ncbi:MAG: 2Fe-2S iron-sulfur cluster binding domain-containing protein [Gemmatimonadaceae bacterium]|nr:2Fe-2S iron-sulfur cluster binding domain-containing protein [Gloeobacterales cyanobacterium ES-bin-141]
MIIRESPQVIPLTANFTCLVHHRGQKYRFTLTHGLTVLASINAQGLALPSSCEAGVCTTCAVRLLSGKVDQREGMGLSLKLQQDRYALLCISHPLSDLEIETEKEDEVYNLQFG